MSKSTSIKVGDKQIVINPRQAHTAATLGQYVAETLGKDAFTKINPKRG